VPGTPPAHALLELWRFLAVLRGDRLVVNIHDRGKIIHLCETNYHLGVSLHGKGLGGAPGPVVSVGPTFTVAILYYGDAT
jgi:hypothetical protein